MIKKNCLVIGSDKTGKSALIEQICQQIYLESYNPTIFSTREKEFHYLNNNGTIEFIELGGTLYSDDFRRKMYRFIDFVLICFTLTSKTSLNKVKAIVSEINKERPHMTKILIGTNGDSDERVIEFDQAKMFVKKLQFNRYVELSSKTGLNIQALIDTILIPILFDERSCADSRQKDTSDFKICLWGSKGSGKTAIRETLSSTNSAPSFYIETKTTLKLCGRFYNTTIGELYDCADDIRIHALTGYNVLGICVDLTDRASFERALSYEAPPGARVAVIGTHTDEYSGSGGVSTEDVEELVAALGAVAYTEGNAKSSADALRMMEEILTALLELA